MDCVLGRDSDRKNLREQRRPGHAGDGAKRIDGALELSLRRGIDAAGHEGLNCGCGDSPERDERNHGENDPSASGESESCEA